jgi:hypothetical protein
MKIHQFALAVGCRTLLASRFLAAETVTVALVSERAGGILPYTFAIDGMATDAYCYDFFGLHDRDRSWRAEELTLEEAANKGQYSNRANALSEYQQVGWLSAPAVVGQQDKTDLQHAIWNVLAPGTFTVTAGMNNYLSRLSAAQNSHFSGFSFENLIFVEPVGQVGSPEYAQAFVTRRGGGGKATDLTPEPSSGIILVIGIALVGLSTRLKR